MKTMNNQERVGQLFTTTQGYIIEIIYYKNATNLIIEFKDEYRVRLKTTYNLCKRGEIKNPYHPTLYNVGYLGMYKGEKLVASRFKREYEVWSKMIARCYNKSLIPKSGITPTVCKRWHCFANFLEDLPLIENYNLWLTNPKQRVALDKDLKQPTTENKIYSLETCIFLTASDNSKEVNTRVDRTTQGGRNARQVVCVETGQVFQTVKQASEWAGVGDGNISRCCQGKIKTSGGFHWKYYELAKNLHEELSKEEK